MRFSSGHISKYSLKLKKKTIPESPINKDYDGKKNLKNYQQR